MRSGLLALDIRIGERHAEARLFAQFVEVKVLIPHNDTNRIGRRWQEEQFDSVSRSRMPMNNQQHARQSPTPAPQPRSPGGRAPGHQPTHDSRAKAAAAERLAGARRHVVLGSPMIGCESHSHDCRSSCHGGRGRREDRPNVFADGDERVGARGRPARKWRAARVEVMHDVVLGAKLRPAAAARGTRPQDVRAERVRVHDIDSLFRYPTREPGDVERPERSVEIREGVLADTATVVDLNPGALEVRDERPIRRKEGDLVIGAGSLGSGREVGEEPLGPSDVAARDDVHTRTRFMDGRSRRGGCHYHIPKGEVFPTRGCVM